MASNEPSSLTASRIAATVFGEATISCERFTTGLRHWVYDVVLESHRNVVVRLSLPDHRDELAGGVFWHDRLRDAGVPVPSVLAHDLEAAQPYMILERLPGTDLGNVMDELTRGQLQRIATAVMAMQECTSSLPRAPGYGYALNYDGLLQPSWRAVIEASINRAAREIHRVGAVDPKWAPRVRDKLAASASALNVVEPIAFLHDATTKNVIVSNGEVSGLVDVDHMAFGDPLWAIALTRMSLLSAQRQLTYIDFLAGAIEDQYGSDDRLDLYTAVFCLGFLAELGQKFNQTAAGPIDPVHRQHLEAVMASLL